MSIIGTPVTTIIDGDQSWLASAHGQWNARTVTLDLSKFTPGTHFKNGHLPQGFPLAIGSDGFAGPYTGTDFAGHLMHDLAVATGENGRVAAPMLDHGRVVASRVPLEGFTKPTTQANSTITYL
ncbi:hypothetical protein [Rothia nasimurium]|uniref:hypothetical protein n=1 Tax=Rothia nasimurium TaxID=85336 RepID=UPI001F19C0E1|nr:hypothetical protein [Rothia nasimurium]